MAWLGFGISAAALLLVWTVNISVFAGVGNRSIAALYMLLILALCVLGMLGLIFSIVGLVTALRHDMPKWVGACGIVFCCLSVVSVFVPFIAAGFIEKEPVEVMTPASVADVVAEQVSVTEAAEPVSVAGDTDGGCDMLLKISRYGKVRCYNLTEGADGTPAVLSAYSYDLKHEIGTWMRMNGLDTDSPVGIRADENADYSDVVTVIDALHSMGMNRYRMVSDNTVSR